MFVTNSFLLLPASESGWRWHFIILFPRHPAGGETERDVEWKNFLHIFHWLRSWFTESGQRMPFQLNLEEEEL